MLIHQLYNYIAGHAYCGIIWHTYMDIIIWTMLDPNGQPAQLIGTSNGWFGF